MAKKRKSTIGKGKHYNKLFGRLNSIGTSIQPQQIENIVAEMTSVQPTLNAIDAKIVGIPEPKFEVKPMPKTRNDDDSWDEWDVSQEPNYNVEDESQDLNDGILQSESLSEQQSLLMQEVIDECDMEDAIAAERQFLEEDSGIIEPEPPAQPVVMEDDLDAPEPVSEPLVIEDDLDTPDLPEPPAQPMAMEESLSEPEVQPEPPAQPMAMEDDLNTPDLPEPPAQPEPQPEDKMSLSREIGEIESHKNVIRFNGLSNDSPFVNLNARQPIKPLEVGEKMLAKKLLESSTSPYKKDEERQSIIKKSLSQMNPEIRQYTFDLLTYLNEEIPNFRSMKRRTSSILIGCLLYHFFRFDSQSKKPITADDVLDTLLSKPFASALFNPIKKSGAERICQNFLIAATVCGLLSFQPDMRLSKLDEISKLGAKVKKYSDCFVFGNYLGSNDYNAFIEYLEDCKLEVIEYKKNQERYELNRLAMLETQDEEA